MVDVFTNPRREMTKEFISVLMGNDLPVDLRDVPISEKPIENGRLLLRLTFLGESANDPVISDLVKSFAINVAILYGNIDAIKDTPYGRMLVSITGPQEVINDALDYLRQRDLRIEVIGYVP